MSKHHVAVWRILALFLCFMTFGCDDQAREPDQDSQRETDKRPVKVLWRRPTDMDDRLRRAYEDLRVLEQLRLPNVASHDPVLWVMALFEADKEGVQIDAAEVDEWLSIVKDERAVRGLTVEGVDDILRRWLTVQHHKANLLGIEPISPSQVQVIREIAKDHPQVWEALERMNPMSLLGTPTPTEQELRQFIKDTQCRVEISAVELPLDDELRLIDGVDELSVQSLFEKHKGDLPGEGEPYGFGYRYPDRVQLEYLAFNIDIAEKTLKSDISVEVEGYEYYQKHREDFRMGSDVGNDDEPQYRPYEEVRDQIVKSVRLRRAQHIVRKAARSARSMMFEDMASLKQQDGYYETDNWEPIQLIKVAERIQQRFGFLPHVTRLDDRWLSRQAIKDLPGFGEAVYYGEMRPMVVVDYIMQTREIASDGAFSRLQSKAPSESVEDSDRNVYVFRLTRAQASHVPQTLEVVRSQVERDARRLKAFENMVARSDQLMDQYGGMALHEVATQLGLSLIHISPFPRHDLNRAGLARAGFSPSARPRDKVDLLLSDASFVSAVHDQAERLHDEGRLPRSSRTDPPESDLAPPNGVQPAPAGAVQPRLPFDGCNATNIASTGERTLILPVKRTMTLFLVHIDSYDVPDDDLVQRMLHNPTTAIAWFQLTHGDRFDRLTREAFEQRLGWSVWDEE